MKRLVLITALFFVAALGLTNATGLETIMLNGSQFYHTWNEGSISNNSWINYSLSQYATTEGNYPEQAAWRLTQYQFEYGVAFLNENGTIDEQTRGLWPAFKTYGYSDNSTYWRTEANYSWGQRVLSMQDSQQANDDLINTTISFTGNINLQKDYWLAVKFYNYTLFNLVNYGNGTAMYSGNATGNWNATNWTGVTISNGSWGWQFMTDNETKNALVVQNNSIYLAWLVGKHLNGRKEISYQRIDVDVCTQSCGSGDGIILELNQLDGNAGGQCGYGLVNNSWSMRWTDTLGTCSLGQFCRLNLKATQPYGTKQTSTINYTDGQNNWIICNLQSEGLANGGCILEGYYKAKTNGVPTKSAWYYFNTTQISRYNMGLNIPAVTATLTQSDGTVPGSPTSGETPAGFDGSNATIELLINGVPVANNSINTVYTTNGSLTYANVTFQFNYNKSAGYPVGSLGEVNNSCLWLNRTTGRNCTDLPDNFGGTHSITYIDLNNTARYQVCTVVNNTNRATGTGQKGINQTCYNLAFTILPTPTPANQITSYTPAIDYGEEIEEEGTKPNYFMIGFVITCLIGFAWATLRPKSAPRYSP